MPLITLPKRGRTVVVFSNLAAHTGALPRFSGMLFFVFALLAKAGSGSEPAAEGVSSREAKMQAIQAVPFKQLSNQTSQALRDVLDNPSFYRRMPSQTIQCDPELFNFLVRKPEIMVNTWDLMGITKVTAKRTSAYSFLANDGVGTRCKCDLVYGDNNIHIYYGVGDYDGSMTPRSVKGRAVCILRSDSQVYPQGHSGHIVKGTMDVFLKLDNLGADLLTRTFGPLVAKTADHNFAETAQFVSQLSQVCATNPSAALALAGQLNDVDDNVRQEFVTIATRIGESKDPARLQSGIAKNADSRVMSETLAELKGATTVPPMSAALSERDIQNNRTARSAEPMPIQLGLSDDQSNRRGTPSQRGTSSNNVAAVQVAPLQLAPNSIGNGQSNPGSLPPNQLAPIQAGQGAQQLGPPSVIVPRKSNITMRR